MGDSVYQLHRLPPQIGNLQKCLISCKKLRTRFWNDAENYQVWVRLAAASVSWKYLCRLCDSGNEDAASDIKLDMRVVELFPPEKFQSRDGDKEEIDLARYIMRLEGREEVSEEKFLGGTGRSRSMKFNDTLCCTSNDIQILMPTTIRRMALTVVFASDSLLPGSSVYKSLRTSAVAEKIRDVLEANGMRVLAGAVVDLRQCPLAQSSLLCPAVSYIYVEECLLEVESGIGKVNSKTEISITQSHPIDYYGRLFESIQPSCVSLAGLEIPMKLLEQTIRIQEERRKKSKRLLDQGHFSAGFLIAGSPGCGKSLVVRETAKKLQANLLVFSGSSVPVYSTSLFCEKISNVFGSAVKSALSYPTVLLLEDLEVLSSVGKSAESQSSLAKGKLVGHLCDLLDNLPEDISLTVVVTSSKPHLLPSELRLAGRLQQEVYIRLPNEMERHKILGSLIVGNGAFTGYDLSQLARLTPGYAGADLEKLVHTATIKCLEEAGTRVSEANVKYALSRVFPTSLQGSVGLIDIQRAISLDDIAGLHSVKLDLIKAIVWPLKYPNAFLTMGIQPPKGILLYGPPGCAKTSLVRAMAASHQTNFLSVSAAELFSSAVGDSEKIIVDLFHRARLASPCILFIDELEAVVGSRQGRRKGVNEGILSTFLTEMDGVGTRTAVISGNLNKDDDGNVVSGPGVIVVAATNRPDLIDSALLRPGRLDRIIPVPPPDESGRLELLRKSTARMPLAEDVDLTVIAAQTERYSGADLVNLCKEAALFALTENMDIQSVAMKDFNRAKAESSPSLSVDLLKRFQEYSHPQQQQPKQRQAQLPHQPFPVS